MLWASSPSQLQWCEQRKGSLGYWWAFRASAENECEMVSIPFESPYYLLIALGHEAYFLSFPWWDLAASFSLDATCCSSPASSFSVSADTWGAQAGWRASLSLPAANSREASPYCYSYSLSSRLLGGDLLCSSFCFILHAAQQISLTLGVQWGAKPLEAV